LDNLIRSPRLETSNSSLKAAEQVYQALYQRIIAGELPAHSKVTEVGVAEELQLSRTPVREAIKRLMHEGFLTRIPGEGVRVAGFDAGEIEEIFRLRLMLECYAAERAARFASPAQIAELQHVAAEMLAIVPPRDDDAMTRISELNARFHSLVIEAACAPRLAATLSSVTNLWLVLRTYRLYSSDDIQRSARHHQEIATAIASGAGEWAASVMAAHLNAAAATVSSTDR
jgi:DNA-binding GntR family transcriptional regulator